MCHREARLNPIGFNIGQRSLGDSKKKNLKNIGKGICKEGNCYTVEDVGAEGVSPFYTFIQWRLSMTDVLSLWDSAIPSHK